MSYFYIQECSKKGRINFIFKNILNKLEIKENIIEIPIKEKVTNKKMIKIARKMKERNIKLVVLSKYLEKQELLKKTIYSEGIDILDGRLLFKVLSINIIEDICKKMKIDIKTIEVSILVNKLNSLNKRIILEMAKKVKTINIITNHTSDFKSIEEFLYSEEGIVIKISNNKKKSMVKSKVVLNLDFCEEEINEYNLPIQSIIVNVSNSIKIKTKKFNGININDYNIIIPSMYKIDKFRDEAIYESLIYNLDAEEIEEKILEDNIKIKHLVGEKGIIQESEFEIF